jgi:hypothetical protein
LSVAVTLSLFVLGFLAAPFVGIGVLMFAENLGFDNPLIFGVGITAYLFFYMGLWFWLKKKGIFKLKL